MYIRSIKLIIILLHNLCLLLSLSHIVRFVCYCLRKNHPNDCVFRVACFEASYQQLGSATTPTPAPHRCASLHHEQLGEWITKILSIISCHHVSWKSEWACRTAVRNTVWTDRSGCDSDDIHDLRAGGLQAWQSVHDISEFWVFSAWWSAWD